MNCSRRTLLSLWKRPLWLFIWLVLDTCSTMAVIQLHIYNVYWQSQECLDLRQSQRLFTAQGLEEMLLYLCTIRNKDNASLSAWYCSLRLTIGPMSFQGLYSSTFSQSSEKCRLLLWNCIMCLSMWLLTSCVFTPTAFGSLICDSYKHILKNGETKKTISFRCARYVILTVFFSILLLCRLGKLQDTQKKLCFCPWRSGSGFAVWPPTTFWR